MPTRKRFTDDAFRKEPWFRSLCSALLTCENEEEMASLLRDIGTLSELQAWSERLEVAKALAKGMSYRAVAKTTGASTTTVTRVAKFLENGTGGYRKLLKAHRHHRLVTTSEGDIAKSSKSESSSPLQKYLSRKDGNA